MYQVINNTVKVPLSDLKDNSYNGIETEKKGRKYAYLNLDQYEDFLSILQDTKFKKGDRVFWVNNKYRGSIFPNEVNEETINTGRIDQVSKVRLSFSKYHQILGDDIRYETEQVNGDKKGIAYETYLIKVEDFNRLNGTNY